MKIQQRERILTEKGKHIMKSVDQPMQKLKGKTKEIMYNCNSKLKGTHKHTHEKNKK